MCMKISDDKYQIAFELESAAKGPDNEHYQARSVVVNRFDDGKMVMCVWQRADFNDDEDYVEIVSIGTLTDAKRRELQMWLDPLTADQREEQDHLEHLAWIEANRGKTSDGESQTGRKQKENNEMTQERLERFAKAVREAESRAHGEAMEATSEAYSKVRDKVYAELAKEAYAAHETLGQPTDEASLNHLAAALNKAEAVAHDEAEYAVHESGDFERVYDEAIARLMKEARVTLMDGETSKTPPEVYR